MRKLTSSQDQLFHMLMSGRSGKDIAISLGIKPTTLIDRCQLLYEKKGVTTRLELMSQENRRLHRMLVAEQKMPAI